jgi:hypothetical protein
MFDWSNLERNSIINFIMELSPKLCEQTISVTQFHKILSSYIKKHWPVTVNQGWDIKVKKLGLFVGGTYYSDRDENGKKCISLELVYNPLYNKINLSKRRFKNMCSVIADTLLHEIIHMRQYRRRDFKMLPDYNSTASSSKIREEQGYLGCTDEIDAYGFNIACELLDQFRGNYKLSIDFLSKNLTGSRGRSIACWRMYLKAFKHDHDHEIIKRLKRKVIRYLPRAEVGKPFKSRDWICH